MNTQLLRSPFGARRFVADPLILSVAAYALPSNSFVRRLHHVSALYTTPVGTLFNDNAISGFRGLLSLYRYNGDSQASGVYPLVSAERDNLVNDGQLVGAWGVPYQGVTLDFSSLPTLDARTAYAFVLDVPTYFVQTPGGLVTTTFAEAFITVHGVELIDSSEYGAAMDAPAYRLR